MSFSPLTALTPLDGRYASRLGSLRSVMSECALIRHRMHAEVAWFLALCDEPKIKEVGPITDPSVRAAILALVPRDDGPESEAEFVEKSANKVKEIERETNHDVKAVEYHLKDLLSKVEGVDPSWVEFVHFALTSEDVNNVAYAGMVAKARMVVSRALGTLCDSLDDKAEEWADVPMMSRTHGQPATPTTLGKEIANISFRLRKHLKSAESVELTAKMNGAVGNYNAHLSAYPDVDWPKLSARAIDSLGWGLTQNEFTTQIEPHECLAELLDALCRAATTLTDLARDMWGYISLGYLRQRVVKGEVGSSTMPHKVNPIDFENAEGNAGVAVSLMAHMARKLPVSRFQRDLSDSTVLRNLGSAFAYLQIAVSSASRGMGKVAPDADKIAKDLDNHWEILAEPIQTVMRKHAIEKPYEKLKEFTRGEAGKIDAAAMKGFVKGIEGLPKDAKDGLANMTPASYTGNAAEAARAIKRRRTKH